MSLYGSGNSFTL